jgi:hypothetical protein
MFDEGTILPGEAYERATLWRERRKPPISM